MLSLLVKVLVAVGLVRRSCCQVDDAFVTGRTPVRTKKNFARSRFQDPISLVRLKSNCQEMDESRNDANEKDIFHSRRRIFIAAATFASIPVITVDAEDVENDGGRLIEFTVTNLDGEEGASGSFVIRTHPSWAPIGVKRFEELTELSFWDGCRIFRVLPGFVAQFGLNGNPEKQAYWRNKRLSDDPVKVSNSRGTVVFATAGPGTRTTQIFINTGKRNDFLDKQGFSPIGEVVTGMDVVDRFYSGYGEGMPAGKGPNQALMQAKGAEYVNKAFPKLSFFTKAVFLEGN